VLLALSTTACAKAKNTDNANNASLTPPQGGPSCDQAPKFRLGLSMLGLITNGPILWNTGGADAVIKPENRQEN